MSPFDVLEVEHRMALLDHPRDHLARVRGVNAVVARTDSVAGAVKTALLLSF